ncbi:MAG TPA: S8 family peptidase [Micromonosporaceae bacterium]|nr:S8 family peptidase [Micromonosporaceae bacterium]
MTRHLFRRLVLPVGLALAVSGLTGPGSAFAAGPPAAAGDGQVRYLAAPDAVPDSYVVVLKDGPATASAGTTRTTASRMAAQYRGVLRFTYTASIKGFAVRTGADQARRLAADPRVSYVAQDRTVTANVFVQPNPPSWGLDRIDQRSLPLDLRYHYPNLAPRVKAYVIDTGIRYTHQEFSGRAVLGVDTIGDGQNGNDCHGHGTHVAGTLGGKTVGVAKQVKLFSVRVLNCSGSGSFSQVIAGVDWVTANAPLTPGGSVANMSLGGGVFQPLDDAVTASIAADIHYSVAAGGSNTTACNFSPARVPRATTVGSTGTNDARASFSNFGPCLDLFAPGMTIYSAWATADDAYLTISGTSTSAPHAAGTAALWRERFPADNADTVAAALVANATPGVVTNPGTGSPNLLLFMGMIPS